MPARITEPAVGAAVCASGSQVWKGKSGTLIANARNNPQNASDAKAKSFKKGRLVVASSIMSKVPGVVAVLVLMNIAMIARSIKTEPARVYKKNLMWRRAAGQASFA